MRQGIERFFSSAKRSRLLDKHQYVDMRKIEAHVALSMLTYLATMYARIEAGDADRMRHMRIQVWVVSLANVSGQPKTSMLRCRCQSQSAEGTE